MLTLSLPAVAALFGVLALMVPTYVLLAADLVLTVSTANWEVSGVAVDHTDLAIAAIAFSMMLRRGGSGKSSRDAIPFLGLWILLGILESAAYLHAPVNQGNLKSLDAALTGPVALMYQLYRYCWKPILFYPLAVVLLKNRRELDTVLLALVVAADLSSLYVIWLGGTEGITLSSFGGKNDFGGALAMAFVLCLAATEFARSGRQRIFYVVSMVLIGRGIMFVGSRGTFVATVAGATFFLTGLLRSATGRLQVARFAGVGLLLATLMLAFVPDLFERPLVSRLLSASTDTSTFHWRLEERWPHFWAKVAANPWLGIGEHVDPNLGASANTPHNGYLSLAVRSGIPAALIFVGLAAVGFHAGLRSSRCGAERSLAILGLGSAAAIGAFLVNNIVDSTALVAYPARFFWILTAVALVMARHPERFAARAAETTAAAPGRALVRWQRS